MKHNWSYSTIGVELKTSSGGTPNKMHKEFYEGGNIPWLRSGEVCKKNITETEMFITQKGMDNSSAKWFPENTVLVAMYGATAGQVGILRFPSTTNQAICGIFPNDKFLPEFLYYTLLHSKDTLVSQAVGNAQPNISQIKVKEVPLPKISIEEQQKIVEILDKEFEKIDTLQANAEKGLQQAKDLFQSALKQELQLKEGWNKCVMSDVCELSQGLAINAKTKHLIIEHSSTPLLRIKDLKDNTESIYVDGDKCPKGSMVDVQDIIYTRTGTLGLVFTGRKGVMHNNCFKIKINENIINKTYFIYYISSALFRDKVIRLAERAAQPDITHRIFGSQIFEYPSIEKQINIAKCLNKLNEHCNALQKNYEKTIALCNDMKQALLRKAFNGEL